MIFAGRNQRISGVLKEKFRIPDLAIEHASFVDCLHAGENLIKGTSAGNHGFSRQFWGYPLFGMGSIFLTARWIWAKTYRNPSDTQQKITMTKSDWPYQICPYEHLWDLLSDGTAMIFSQLSMGTWDPLLQKAQVFWWDPWSRHIRIIRKHGRTPFWGYFPLYLQSIPYDNQP